MACPVRPSEAISSFVCPWDSPLMASGACPNTCPGGTKVSEGLTLAIWGSFTLALTVTPPAGAALESLTRRVRVRSTFSARSPAGSKPSEIASTCTAATACR